MERIIMNNDKVKEEKDEENTEIPSKNGKVKIKI